MSTTPRGIDPAEVGLRIARPTRESIETKGKRYVLEGRLTVRYVGPDGIRATCKGQGAAYTVTFDRVHRTWSCDCPARGRCAHLVALQLVTVEDS